MKSFISKTFLLIITLLFALLSSISSQNASDGIFKDHSDIGNPELTGSASYDHTIQEYLLEGAGYNIWFDRDEFHYLWCKIKGDFILKATCEFVGTGVELHRKIGWMIRNDLSSGSAHASAVVHGDGLTSLQYRKTGNTAMEEVRSDDQSPHFIQLERKGNNYYMITSSDDHPPVTVHLENMPLNKKVYAGLFICSHNPGVKEKAIFRNVEICTQGKKK